MDGQQRSIMKARKFTSFEEMKSFESKSTNDDLSVKKHKEFERIIKEIRSANVQSDGRRSKQ